MPRPNYQSLIIVVAVGVFLHSLTFSEWITSAAKSDLHVEKTSISSADGHKTFNSVVNTTELQNITPGKYMYTCDSGCIDFSQPTPACIGGFRAPFGPKRPWKESDDYAPIGSAINLTGNTISILVSHDNINHAFHDDMFTGLAWLHHLKNQMTLSVNLNIIIHAESSPWAYEFLSLCNATYNWQARDFRLLTSPHKMTICSEGGKMFMNGYLRNINAYGLSVIELKQMRQEIRQMALQNGQVRHIHSNKDEFDIIKEHIVIYTRQDSQWRNLLEVQELIRLFDLDKYSISVVHSMPTSFYGQVELFANADCRSSYCPKWGVGAKCSLDVQRGMSR
jgi:hypothetical protein